MAESLSPASPIELLPTEILIEVFRLALHEVSNSPHPHRGDPQGLRHTGKLVCKRWYDIFAADISFQPWRVVSVFSPEDWQKILDLRGELRAPVTRHIHVDFFPKGEVAFESLATLTDSSSVTAVHIKSFRLSSLWYNTPGNIFGSLAQVVTAIAILQGYGDEKDGGRKDMLVEEVELCGDQCPPQTIISFPKSFETFTQLRRLTLQRLRLWILNGTGSLQSIPPIHLPQLQTLILDNVFSDCVGLFYFLRVPKLENLAFKVLGETITTGDHDHLGPLAELPPMTRLHKIALYGSTSKSLLTALGTTAVNVSKMALYLPGW